MRELELANRRGVALVDDEKYAAVVAVGSWYLTAGGYAAHDTGGRKNRKTLLLHRFVLDAPEGVEVDHRNGNGLDCRIENLREATHAQNQQNQGKQCGSYSSQYVGVSWSEKRGKWRATITYDRKTRDLGFFAVEEDAARARDREALKVFGEFAHLNFPHELRRAA